MTTMTPARPLVTGGVDIHRDEHVAAALDLAGGLLGTASFPTTTAGYVADSRRPRCLAGHEPPRCPPRTAARGWCP